MGKPLISTNRVYDILARCDDAEDVFDFTADQRAALMKAKRLGYLQPAAFRASHRPRPSIVRYAVTQDGWDFIHRVEAAAEAQQAAIRRSLRLDPLPPIVPRVPMVDNRSPSGG